MPIFFGEFDDGSPILHPAANPSIPDEPRDVVDRSDQADLVETPTGDDIVLPVEMPGSDIIAGPISFDNDTPDIEAVSLPSNENVSGASGTSGVQQLLHQDEPILQAFNLVSYILFRYR